MGTRQSDGTWHAAIAAQASRVLPAPVGSTTMPRFSTPGQRGVLVRPERDWSPGPRLTPLAQHLGAEPESTVAQYGHDLAVTESRSAMSLDARVPLHAWKGSPCLVGDRARQDQGSAIELELHGVDVSTQPLAGCVRSAARWKLLRPRSAVVGWAQRA